MLKLNYKKNIDLYLWKQHEVGSQEWWIKTVFYSFHSIKHLILASTWPGSHKKGRSSNTTFLWVILGPGSGHLKAWASVASKAEKSTREPAKNQPRAGHQGAWVPRYCSLGGAPGSWWEPHRMDKGSILYCPLPFGRRGSFRGAVMAMEYIFKKQGKVII